MTLDRAEMAGTGAAVLFHVVVIAALSIHLATVPRPSEPPPMEVELVEEVGLQSAAPTPTPPPSQAPEIGEAPVEEPLPKIEPVAPRESVTPSPKPPTPRPAKPVQVKPAPRVSRIGDDFLKGVPNAPAAATAKPAATTVSASAMAGIVQAIRRQVQPCADRQVDPGPGANRIKVRLHLRLSRAGRLAGQPEIVGVSGVDDDNRQYEERVKDIAVATFVGCAPLTGLPQDLYKTADGRGWSDFIMVYNLP